MINHTVINGASSSRHSEMLLRHEIPTDVLTTALIVKNAVRCARRLQSGLLGDLAHIIERVSRGAAGMDGMSAAAEPSACVGSQASLQRSV